MLALVGSLTFLFYTLSWFIRGVGGWSLCRGKTNRFLFELRTGLLIVSFNLAVSPLLHKLLATVSSDTIQAMAISLLAANCLFHDYSLSIGCASYRLGSNTTAKSVGLLAALSLASRLANEMAAFTLLIVALLIFDHWPGFVNTMRLYYGRRVQPFFTLGIGLTVTVLSLHLISSTYNNDSENDPSSFFHSYYRLTFCSVIAIATFLLVNLVGPWLFVKMQKLKTNIYGPWDEAVAQP